MNFGTLVLLGFIGSACAIFGPPPRISAGPADDVSDPFARLEDRTVVPAYEFGLCQRDDDCAPRGCGAAVCSPSEEPAVCIDGAVAECFSALPPHHCGCNEGVCRWERVGPVMQCALLAAQRPTNRAIEGAGSDERYPIQND